MKIDDAIEIKKPEPDSHFRLSVCRCCKGDNVAYVKYLDKGSELWRVQCFDCGHVIKPVGALSRHDVQIQWNGVAGCGQMAMAARAAG